MMEINLMQVQIHPTGAKIFTMILDAIGDATFEELESVREECLDPVISRLAKMEIDSRIRHKMSKEVE